MPAENLQCTSTAQSGYRIRQFYEEWRTKVYNWSQQIRLVTRPSCTSYLDEIATLTKKVEEYKNTHIDRMELLLLESQLQKEQQKNQLLEQKLAEKRNVKNEAEIQELTLQLQVKETEIQRLNQILLQKKSQETLLETMKLQLIEKEARIHQLEQSLREKENDESKQTVEVLLLEMQQLQEQNKEFQQNVTLLRNEKHLLSTQLDEVKKEISFCSLQLEDALKKKELYHKLQEDYSILESQSKRDTLLLNSFKQQITDLEGNVDYLKKQVKHAQENVDGLTSQLRSVTLEKQELNAQMEQLRISTTSIIADKEKVNQQLQEELNTIRTQQQALLQKLTMLTLTMRTTEMDEQCEVEEEVSFYDYSTIDCILTLQNRQLLKKVEEPSATNYTLLILLICLILFIALLGFLKFCIVTSDIDNYWCVCYKQENTC